MKAKNQNKTCPEALSNECVVWQGGDVPSLGICNGDELSISEKIIADKVSWLLHNLDLSSVDISCLLDVCSNCEDKSLVSIIQLLYDNQCSLKDLINSSTGASTPTTIVVNMRCLKKFDDFGNEIPQDLNASLQSLVNEVCIQESSILSIQSNIIDLQNQIDSIPIVPPPTEPSITTCLTPGIRPVSQVVPLVTQDYCGYKAVVGSTIDISKALSLQPGNLNPVYQNITGWNNTVDSLAKSVSNLWVVVGNLLTRVGLIETNCCAVTCDDIKIGFDVILNASGDSVNLKFTSKAGTSIPNGFTDCGSIVTITDKNGTSVQYNLKVSNNANEGEFFITGLDLSDFLSFEVTANLCTDGLTCQKCSSKLFNPNAAICPYCEITATGDSGSFAVILYHDINTPTVLSTIIVNAGQTVIVKKSINVVSVGLNGNVSLNAPCFPNLLALTETYNCYKFSWSVETNRTPSGVLEHQDVTITKLMIGSDTYTVPGISADTAIGFQEWLASKNLTGFIQFDHFGDNSTGSTDARFAKYLWFKTLPSLAVEMSLRLDGPTFDNGLWVYPLVANNECTGDNSSSS
jgi:hypothetical protein